MQKYNLRISMITGINAKKQEPKQYLIFLILFLSLVLSSYTIIAQERKSDTFEIRGFHLDMREQVMTPKALKSFADKLSSMKMNTLVMEWEGTYPYKKHSIISNPYSYSKEDVDEFIAYCENKGIQVIPLQQTLGHTEYILRHPKYSDLRVDRQEISQINPLKIEESKILFKELLADMAETHNSQYIHIGGDETRILEECDGCQQKIEREGISKLYVDYIKAMAQIVIDLGKTPVMWADMILQHPEAAAELPKELILIDWNYGWKTNHFGDIPSLQDQGFTFWGAPAIRSHPDNWYLTTWPTHFQNLKEFIPYARKANYKAIIMTSWSTSGLYGFIWGDGYEVIDMIPVRDVYPMDGFNLLIDGFKYALDSKEPFKAKGYVREYGSKTFGLNQKETAALFNYLNFKQAVIPNENSMSPKRVMKLKEEFLKVVSPIEKIQPQKSKKEFEHFILMAKLRLLYLDFMKIKAAYNTESYTEADAESLKERLAEIIKRGKQLNKKFIALNRGFLYDSELEELNERRLLPMRVLYSRLNKTKKTSFYNE